MSFRVALNFHEDLRRSEETQGSSDRNLGVVFALAFTVAGLAPLRGGGHVRTWALGAAGLFLMAALIRPGLLGPLNRFWTKLGLVLGRIVNPVVSAVLFFAVFTPAGVIARLLGKDLLRMKRDPDAKSYWIQRDPPGPRPESMSKQF